MSIQIECMEPRSAKHIVGGLLGKDISVFQIQGAGCAEVKHWLEAQSGNMHWVAHFEDSQLEALYLAFLWEGMSEEEVRATNQAYMMFKLAWKGREGVDWQDEHYKQCTLKIWPQKRAAS